MRKNKKRLLVLAFVCAMAFAPAAVQNLTPVTVEAAVTNGWQQIGGYWYFYKNGKKQKGFLNDGGKTYYLDSAGRMCTGLQKLEVGRYYFNADGSMVKNTWVKIGKYWYYFGKDGKALTNQFIKQNGKTYYVNRNGAMYTGMWNINGKKYYFDNSGAMQFGWQQIGGYWYYFNKDGSMHHGWLELGDETYFCLKSGKMATGRVKNSKGQYYFFNPGTVRSNDSKVGELQRGWTKVNANWYHMNEKTGIISYGMTTVDGETYYLNPKSGIREYGLRTIDGKLRYFATGTGKMVKNQKLTISGKVYEFDANGVGKIVSDYIINADGSVKVLENGKWFNLRPEYLKHPGVADGTLQDDDLLAMLVDAESNDQGQAGMTAVALTILNRTLPENDYYSNNLRYVIYSGTAKTGQYAPVWDGALSRRLNGVWEEKEMAYEAVATAKKILKNYREKGTPRRVPGISTTVMGRSDFDCLFFMTPGAFQGTGCDWEESKTFQYRGHVFFTYWT